MALAKIFFTWLFTCHQTEVNRLPGDDSALLLGLNHYLVEDAGTCLPGIAEALGCAYSSSLHSVGVLRAPICRPLLQHSNLSVAPGAVGRKGLPE